MPRTRLALSLLFASAVAGAAPVPKQLPRTFENFGTVAEIKGVKCDSSRPGEVRIRLSADAATESDAHEKARPNVARTVEGDFELTVRITHAPADAKTVAASAGKGEVIAAAGIALYKPDGTRGTMVVLNRLSKGDDAWDTYFKMDARYETKKARGGIGDLTQHHTFANAPVYLRLTRRGDEFTTTESEDGKAWTPVFKESHTILGLGDVAIGPVAVHNTTGRYEVTFDEYTLTQPAKEKK